MSLSCSLTVTAHSSHVHCNFINHYKLPFKLYTALQKCTAVIDVFSLLEKLNNENNNDNGLFHTLYMYVVIY